MKRLPVWTVLAVLALALAGCGKKPPSVDAPEGVNPDPFPRVYPNPTSERSSWPRVYPTPESERAR